MRTLSSFLIASSLFACATTSEDVELPDTIVDGSVDSWGYPTKFGRLFEETWQFGELDPARNIKFPAWTFELSGDATVTITSRQAPTDEPDLGSSVIYLYKQRD